MARILYIEFDDEITDVVERIRTSGEDKDLVFVVPNRAPVLQSVLNLRVLQQYSGSFHKTTSIVTPDQRAQQFASAAGFTVYGSVQAYDNGIQAQPPPTAGGEVSDGGAPPIGGGGAGLAPVSDSAPRPPSAYGPLRQGATAVAAPVAVQAATATRRPPAADPRLLPGAGSAHTGSGGARRPPPDRRRTRLYVIAAAVFLVGLLLLFIVAPSARVTIVLEAKPVSVDGMVVQGTPDPLAAKGAGKVQTEVVTIDLPATFDAKPTGQRQIAAAAATTQIQFSTRYTSAFCLAIGKNTVLASSGSIKWAVASPPTSTCVSSGGGGVLVPGSSSGDYGALSSPIQVVASQAGVAGNVAAGAVNQVEAAANGCNPSNYPPGAAPNCDPKTDFKVTNAAPATGGVDARTLTIVSDQDLAAFKNQVTQLTQQGQSKARTDLPAKAQRPGQTYALDPAGNGFATSVDVSPPLPAAGDQYQQTTIAVTVHATGVLYNPDDVTRRVQAALAQKVSEQSPNGTLLGSGQVIKPAQVQQSGADGRVVFNTAGSGFISPAIDPLQLKDGFAGKSRTSVRDIINQRFGTAVQDVQFSQPIPWFTLPYFGSRIEVKVCVHSPTESCS